MRERARSRVFRRSNRPSARPGLDLRGGAGQGARMNADQPLPDECADMRAVRAGVDATDRALMALIERRFDYMRAAARIKTDRSQVRDEARKAAVIANARADAAARGLPADELAALWELLVEASIAYELEEWDRITAGARPAGAFPER